MYPYLKNKQQRPLINGDVGCRIGEKSEEKVNCRSMNSRRMGWHVKIYFYLHEGDLITDCSSILIISCAHGSTSCLCCERKRKY